MKKDLCN